MQFWLKSEMGWCHALGDLIWNDPFVTLKDQKPNFQNNSTSRLFNPSKSEIGVITKQLLQRINSNILFHTNLNQWKKTRTTCYLMV